jgi:hypothetical protein
MLLFVPPVGFVFTAILIRLTLEVLLALNGK